MSGNEQAVAVAFFKKPNGRFELFSIFTSEGPDFRSCSGYDVDWCKRDGVYYYHNSSGSPLLPNDPIEIDGIYWCLRPEIVKAKRCNLIGRENRKRNKTRRLLTIPKAFTHDRWNANKSYSDIFDWLQENGIEDSTNYCSECEDSIPDGEPCEHIWWCDEHGIWSTPTERDRGFKCDCESCKPAMERAA